MLHGSQATGSSLVHRNSVPSTHMRCMITANRRASATIAFFIPRCLAIFIAQALSQDHFAERTSMGDEMMRMMLYEAAQSKYRPDRLGTHASLEELVADVDAMTDAAGEGDGLAALAIFVPVRDDVADELVPVHALGELGLDIVAGLRLDAVQVRVDRGVDPRLDQIALLDQVWHLRALDHGLEDAAEPAAVATAGRCGQPEDNRVGICLEDLLVG